MKTGWVTKRLGEVCEIINGKNQAEVADSSGAYPIYGSGGIMGRANSFRCPAGCTVIGRKGSINNPLYVAEPFWNVDTAYALSPKDVDAKYLFYFCRSFDFGTLNCGTTIPSLTTTIVKDVQMPLAPLAEQKRIVAKIDAAFEKIDRLKANAERNLANAKELFQSALNEAMRPKPGWVEKRLNEIFNFIDYRGKTPTKLTSGIPLITAKNIRMGYLDYSCRDYISQEEFETRQSRGVARRGDILFTTEAPLGFVAMADLDTFSTGQRVITFQQYPDRTEKIENRFYYFYLQARAFQDEIRRLATGATAQGIKASRLKEIKVALPPIDDQRSLVSVLDRMMKGAIKLQSNYTRLIADCAEMRQAVLKEAFEGRL